MMGLFSDHQVRILYAAEAGSRAWGFASPDSDYDIRFLYVRPPDWYLSIRRARDVIEIPIEDELDLSGWDLRKALGLFRDSNPALYEWLVSPIGYRDHDLLGETLQTLAHSSYSLRGLACHYQRMVEKDYAKYIHGRNPVRLKKYFYVIRPLVMIQWMNSMPCYEHRSLNSQDLAQNGRTLMPRINCLTPFLNSRTRLKQHLIDGSSSLPQQKRDSTSSTASGSPKTKTLSTSQQKQTRDSSK